MSRSEAVTNEPYQTYGDKRIEGFSGDTLAAQGGVRDLFNAGLPFADEALSNTSSGIESAFNIGDYSSNPISSANFDSGVAQQYMSPYIQNVLNLQKDRALLDFQRSNNLRNDSIIRAGGFAGNERRAVGDYLAEEGMLSRMAGIDAEGLQKAFEQAQMQFERDRSSGMEADTFNEEQRRLAASLGLEGIQTGLTGSQQLSGLEDTRQKMIMAQIAGLNASGQDQQNLLQSYLDQGYEDFVNQRDYERNNAQFLSGILHGIPVTPNSETTSQGGGNTASELVGTGISALALSKALSGTP